VTFNTNRALSFFPNDCGDLLQCLLGLWADIGFIEIKQHVRG
jgi:hypothetical protein